MFNREKVREVLGRFATGIIDSTAEHGITIDKTLELLEEIWEESEIIQR